MKKILTVFTAVVTLFAASSLFAYESSFNARIGTSYPKAAETLAFDSALSYHLGLDKYFALGLESGFNWVSWEVKQGDAVVGNINASKTQNSNLYTVPAMANAIVRIDQGDMMPVMPYFVAGAGWAWTYYDHPDVDNWYNGFTWQSLAGVAFKLGPDSNMKVTAEIGYRGSKVKDGDYTVDMSGIVAHVGVRFPIGGGYGY